MGNNVPGIFMYIRSIHHCIWMKLKYIHLINLKRYIYIDHVTAWFSNNLIMFLHRRYI